MHDDAGPAFPATSEQTGIFATQGMTLRDYFAAAAMQGLLAAYSGHTITKPSAFASRSYALADAMIAERAKVE